MNFIKKAIFVLIFACFLSNSYAVDWDRVEHDVIAVAERVQSSCFSVETDQGGWGSAVLVSSSGHLISAAHVYQHVGQSVTLHQSGREPVVARVLKLDRVNDIAILATSDAAIFADVELPPFADDQNSESFVVVALGHTSGFQEGRAAPVRLGMGIREGEHGSFLSTCRLSIGDSGGPLFNLSGELIGVHSTIRRHDSLSTHACISQIKTVLKGIDDAG